MGYDLSLTVIIYLPTFRVVLYIKLWNVFKASSQLVTATKEQQSAKLEGLSFIDQRLQAELDILL